MPALWHVKPKLLELDVGRTLSECIFEKRMPSHNHLLSHGELTYMIKYIVHCRLRGDRSVHLDEIMRGMVDRLVNVLSPPCPCATL